MEANQEAVRQAQAELERFLFGARNKLARSRRAGDVFVETLRRNGGRAVSAVQEDDCRRYGRFQTPG